MALLATCLLTALVAKGDSCVLLMIINVIYSKRANFTDYTHCVNEADLDIASVRLTSVQFVCQ